jgi:N6-L-threonylcarbamoyladenine synthase
MAASFQQAVIDVLISKTIKAAKEYKVKTVMLSGGVAANQELRQQTTQFIKKELSKAKFYIPDSKLCTDNAAMIATAAYYKKRSTTERSWSKIQTQANLKIT